MPSTPSEVTTSQGPLVGSVVDGVHRFLAIPYAGPPTGDLRFRAPVPAKPWSAPLDATTPSDSAPQTLRAPGGPLPPANFSTDEDCLYLNVHTPQPDDTARPVLFWIHGGSFMTGRGASFDGTSFCRTGDIVVVTINYRLGVLGFVDYSQHDPGLTGSLNNGIRDQIAALLWVRDNIRAFGGDPDQVTIVGESAGAGAVMALLASPAADGLFHRAISQSAPAGFGPPVEGIAEDLMNQLDVGDIDDLRRTAPEELIAAQAALVEAAAATQATLPAGYGRSFRPAIDGITITRSALDAAAERDIPLLLGTNGNEGSLFGFHLPAEINDETLLEMVAEHVDNRATAVAVVDAFRAGHPGLDNRRLAVEMIGDTLFRWSSLGVADTASAAGTPVYVYRFTWKSRGFGGLFGSMHALELPFVWNMDPNGDLKAWETIIGEGSPQPPQLADQMHRAWIGFVRSGDPNHESLPHWPIYELETRPTMIFGDNTEIAEDPHGATRSAWGPHPRF